MKSSHSAFAKRPDVASNIARVMRSGKPRTWTDPSLGVTWYDCFSTTVSPICPKVHATASRSVNRAAITSGLSAPPMRAEPPATSSKSRAVLPSLAPESVTASGVHGGSKSEQMAALKACCCCGSLKALGSAARGRLNT